MSLKLIVELKGKRHTVTVTPMAPLQKVIEDVCFQQKPQLDVSSCRLYHQKKLLDPTTPVRFANLPKEAKLELVTDQNEQRLGLTDRLAPGVPAPLSNAMPAASNEAAQQLASPAVMYAPVNTTPPAQSDTSPAPASVAQQHGGSTISNSPGTSSADRSSHTQTAVSSAQSATDSSSVNEAPSASMHDTKPMPAGLDRHIHVFTRKAAAAAEASSRGDTDLPADFYDFTPDDYQKVMSGWAKKNSQAAGPLKTQKLREQDERRRAEQFGPVPVRIHFPDDSIVQAEFKPLEPLSALQKLVQQCVQPELLKWYMYVTPPKQVLKDLSLTFYKAGLLPAANVLIGVESKHGGDFLKPAVAALQAPPPAREQWSRG
ncbi:MAG: plant UBX domain-containing 1 [Trebouxia sp. A1-2]|nr:MAG: plant UBX domain-containing 1 [Trebouxia sp. A1-2]